MFENSVVLITGGTGSFGNVVVRRLLSTNVREIRVFSRDESKQEDMRNKLNEDRVKFYIGDVRDYDSVSSAMNGVNFVFHAAALKQVPSCEFHPLEAVRTNILGAENVMNAAIANGAARVILLSTDKAVYPINAMGLSKAMMEKMMVAKTRMQSETKTVFCVTRYGNVMASRGSVIPLFLNQIRTGEPITITDPEMTRFLMSLDDSVDLVLHAFEHGNQGDIFVQKAPASTIADLAKAICEILECNHEVNVIGTRHGEKLYESLLSREEMAKAEDLGRYYRVPVDNRDLNYKKYFVEGKRNIASYDDYTSHNTERLDVEGVKALLLNLECVQESLNA